MNNPLVSQSSTPGQKAQGRSRFKVAVFCVLTVHVVGLLALLLQGCKREQAQVPPESPPMVDTNPPPVVADTNPPPVVVDTNPVPVAPTVGAQEHIIVSGDTLGAIAKKYSVTLAALKAANPTVDEKKLQIGHKLVIPAPSATPTSMPHVDGAVSAETGEQIHVVKSGDTLAAIAKKYGVTWQAIQDENKLTTTKIIVGQKLKIPAKTAATPPAQ